MTGSAVGVYGAVLDVAFVVLGRTKPLWGGGAGEGGVGAELRFAVSDFFFDFSLEKPATRPRDRCGKEQLVYPFVTGSPGSSAAASRRHVDAFLDLFTRESPRLERFIREESSQRAPPFFCGWWEYKLD